MRILVVEDDATRIMTEDRAGQPRVAVPPALAVTALRNLVDNALRYSPATAPVRVVIEADARTVTFSVIDQGHGVAGNDTSRATQRFWRAATTHGSGLGLPIVEAIALRYGGDLEMIDRDTGLKARLSLPRAVNAPLP